MRSRKKTSAMPPSRAGRHVRRKSSVSMAVRRNVANAPAICAQNCCRQRPVAIAIVMMQPLQRPISNRLPPSRALPDIQAIRKRRSHTASPLLFVPNADAVDRRCYFFRPKRSSARRSATKPVDRFWSLARLKISRTVSPMPSMCMLVSATDLPSRQK